MIIRTYDNKLINIDLKNFTSDFDIYKHILYIKFNIKFISSTSKIMF
jgi:hypothetical protein